MADEVVSTVVPGGAPPAATDWTTGLSDEHKGYVQTKGFKDPAAVLESYVNLEKLARADPSTIIKLPGKDGKPEDWAPVWDKLGKPKDAKEYQIEMPKTGGDEKFAEWARGTFHKLNLPRGMAEALAKEWNAYAAGLEQQHGTAREAALGESRVALTKEWGAAEQQNVGIAKQAAVALGVDKATIDKLEDAMGYAGVMKFFHGLGAKTGEAAFVTGDNRGGGGFGVKTPEAAKARIAELRNDKAFVQRYTNGDAAAKQEMELLHKQAYPE